MSHKSQNSMFGRQINAKQRLKRHAFNKDIVKQVAHYLNGNNYDGMLEVMEDWAIVAVSIAATLYLYKLSIAVGIVSYMIALIIIGGRQRALADILHQASHGAAASNSCLNWILGTSMSGYAVFQSFTIYTQSHVQLHHPWLGNPYKDPDYIGHITNNICGINRCSETAKKYICSIISPWSSYKYIKYLIKNRIYDENEDKYESIIRLIYWIFILYHILSNGCFTYFTLFWLFPLISSNVWIGSLLELLEHFPMIDDPNIAYIDILISKNRIWSVPVNFILGAHNEGYHLVHHLFPKLPSWHYASVHKILMQDDEYANLNHSQTGCVEMIKQVIQQSGSADAAYVSQPVGPSGLSKYIGDMIKWLLSNTMESFN